MNIPPASSQYNLDMCICSNFEEIHCPSTAFAHIFSSYNRLQWASPCMKMDDSLQLACEMPVLLQGVHSMVDVSVTDDVVQT